MQCGTAMFSAAERLRGWWWSRRFVPSKDFGPAVLQLIAIGSLLVAAVGGTDMDFQHEHVNIVPQQIGTPSIETCSFASL